MGFPASENPRCGLATTGATDTGEVNEDGEEMVLQLWADT